MWRLKFLENNLTATRFSLSSPSTCHGLYSSFIRDGAYITEGSENDLQGFEAPMCGEVYLLSYTPGDTSCALPHATFLKIVDSGVVLRTLSSSCPNEESYGDDAENGGEQQQQQARHHLSRWFHGTIVREGQRIERSTAMAASESHTIDTARSRQVDDAAGSSANSSVLAASSSSPPSVGTQSLMDNNVNQSFSDDMFTHACTSRRLWRRSRIDQSASHSAVPIFSTTWRIADHILLAAERDPTPRLLRVHRTTQVDGTATVLSTSSLFLLDFEKGGAGTTRGALSLLQSQSFDVHLPMAVNAVCASAWGAHATLVGFSDGYVRLVDWREKERGSGSTLEVLVPQPPWVRDRLPASLRLRRSAGVRAPAAAGVLSCCTLGDNYRVVCGLGDQRGCLSVADLRSAQVPSSTYTSSSSQPPAPLTRKRARLTSSQQQLSRQPAAAAQREALMAGGWCVPTGHSICDLCHSNESPGTIGMVDSFGDGFVTSISALELMQRQQSEAWAAESVLVPFFADQQQQQHCGDSGSDVDDVEQVHKDEPQRQSTTPVRPSHTLPSPHRVSSILQSRQPGSPDRHASSPSVFSSELSTYSLQRRCVFAGSTGLGGPAYFVHTRAGAHAFGVQRLCSPYLKEAMKVVVPLNEARQQTLKDSATFTSVSSAGNAVCFGTSLDDTYCFGF